jgi:hypothetical protein
LAATNIVLFFLQWLWCDAQVRLKFCTRRLEMKSHCIKLDQCCHVEDFESRVNFGLAKFLYLVPPIYLFGLPQVNAFLASSYAYINLSFNQLFIFTLYWIRKGLFKILNNIKNNFEWNILLTWSYCVSVIVGGKLTHYVCKEMKRLLKLSEV